MQSVLPLERLREKIKKIKTTKEKNKGIFIKKETEVNRTIYHTKIMHDFFAFGVDKRKHDKFFISFKGIFNQKKIETFNLFSIREDDKFLGIYYGYRKPVTNVVKIYEENGITKAYNFSRVYYIEFKFKKGSIFCYLKGISYLVRKEKIGTKYYQTLIKVFLRLEKELYEFYNKKLPEGGNIAKWLNKNLK
ncbi:DUF226 domain-containing protein (plasmid) [Borrelia sp. A-FGy1]|uniref:DUF226 domain-containing protein n=1 Tax=Borrelia sp. A-FGy1 TaxID=2608247 RepID=UPI0015F55181|nr:DUF226 domain-containing protein [Borrelia sp. A-FGy1]QMU99859.1 DUF226 domain-containing protein [Borrelia sp. A-FGy1]